MAITVKHFLLVAGILAGKRTTAQSIECPEGWYETNGRCFRVFDFGDNEKQSWESAMAMCAAHGTPLATIHSRDEEYLIASLSARYKDECWTGLRKYKRFKPDKGWLWIDRDESLSDYDYLNWGTEWQSVWKILPPDEKCGTVKPDGWGNRPCWGPGSKLQCFACGTLDPNASENAKKAFTNDFSTGNWWVPPPSSAYNGNNIGNREEGWDIGALDAGDSVAIDDPNTFWGPVAENGGGIDPDLLRAETTRAPTTTTTTIPTTTTLEATTSTRATTTVRTTTTNPTTTRPTTTTTTRPTTTTTTRRTTTTAKPTTTTTAAATTRSTTIAPTTTTKPTTTTLPQTTTTLPPTTVSTTTPPQTTQDNKDANAADNGGTEPVEEQESSIITGLAIAVGTFAAAVAAGAGFVAYKRYQNRRMSTSIQSSPETQSFTDMER